MLNPHIPDLLLECVSCKPSILAHAQDTSLPSLLRILRSTECYGTDSCPCSRPLCQYILLALVNHPKLWDLFTHFHKISFLDPLHQLRWYWWWSLSHTCCPSLAVALSILLPPLHLVEKFYYLPYYATP